MIEQLTHEDARKILDAGHDARLACIVDDEPYVVPIHYVLEGDSAYFHSLPGKKIEGLRALPRVCLQVQTLETEYRWRSVQAFGNSEEIADDAERERVLRLLFKRFVHLTPADAVRRDGQSDVAPIVVRIRIDRIVGVGEG